MGKEIVNIFSIDISKLADVLVAGKPFEAMTFGEFTDMGGWQVEFKQEDLATYVTNTKDAIQATISEDGELVGLPIDAHGHDRGDGAGWIMDIELSTDGTKVLITPAWTEIGFELIEKKIRRWFSATIDVKNKVILGGTLTNWPAMRDKKGKHLLAPVELSSQLQQFFESLDELPYKIRQAFYDAFPFQRLINGEVKDRWVVEVFDDHIIIEISGEGYFVVGYTYNEEEDVYKFDDAEDWKTVKKAWVDAARVSNALGFSTITRTIVNNYSNPKTEDDMKFSPENLEEIQKLVAESLAEILPTALETTLANFTLPKKEGEGGEPDTAAVKQFAERIIQTALANGETDLQDALTSEFVGVYHAIEEQAKVKAAAQIERARSENAVRRFSLKVTQGNPETPQALPAKADELTEFLLGLTPDQAKYAQRLLEGIWKNGLDEFEVEGHSGDVKGRKQLPVEYAERLRTGELEMADLKSPLLGLGDLSDYDLSEFKKVKEA